MKASNLPEHLRKYWKLATANFEAEEWPLATFLAITLIEEVGKVKLIYDAATRSRVDKKAFRNHNQKYAYAVFLTLFVNSRVTRIYGTDEAKFARWFREGGLFRMRNRALYAEFENDRVVLPSAPRPWPPS